MGGGGDVNFVFPYPRMKRIVGTKHPPSFGRRKKGARVRAARKRKRRFADSPGAECSEVSEFVGAVLVVCIKKVGGRNALCMDPFFFGSFQKSHTRCQPKFIRIIVVRKYPIPWTGYFLWCDGDFVQRVSFFVVWPKRFAFPNRIIRTVPMDRKCKRFRPMTRHRVVVVVIVAKGGGSNRTTRGKHESFALWTSFDETLFPAGRDHFVDP